MALTARQVETAKDGSFSDGNGLYLRIRNNGNARAWVFRWKVAGKVRELGLGSTTIRSLKEARALALELRRAIHDGIDPATLLHPEDADAVPTFRAMAEQAIAALRPGWSNAKHAAQWEMTLREYAYPVLGDMLPADITVDHVLKVLTPLWSSKTETATRLRQRIEAVLDRAAVLGFRDRDRVNPAIWKGNLEHLLPKARKVMQRQHFAAVPYGDLPGVMSQLRKRSTMSALCLRMVVLSACRSNEIRGLQWREIDMASKMLTIPADRTKTRRAHVVPLSVEAMVILKDTAALGTTGMVFRNRKDVALSDVALSKELHRFAPGATVHGLRSSFRDWAADTTRHSRETVEQCLAHAIGGVEAAYRRTDMLEKRRAVMDDWARFLGERGKVVSLRGSA